MNRYLKSAKASAQSWGHADVVTAVISKEVEFGKCIAASQLDQWQVNAAVHYNEWANLTKNDFEPVVDAYRNLTREFTCKKCNGVLYATPAVGEAELLRCACGHHSLNLVKKPQG